MQHGQVGTAGQEESRSNNRAGENSSRHELAHHACMIAILVLAPIIATAQPRPQASSIRPPAALTSATTGSQVTLGLVEAVALGLRDNRAIRSAYLERVSERFDLTVAESRFLPKLTVAASAFATRTGNVTTTTSIVAPTATLLTPTGATIQFAWAHSASRSGGIATGTQTTAFSVAQPLLRGAGLSVNLAPIKIAQLQEQINQLNLNATVSDQVTAIVLAYRGLQQAQEQLKLAQLSQERSRSLLGTNHALIAAGRMAAADIVQTQADVANQEVAALQSEQARNSAQLALLRLLAVDLSSNVVATDPVKVEHLSIPLNQVIALGLTHRTDFLARRLALEQSRQTLIIAKNNGLWDLSAVGTGQRERDVGGVTSVPGTLPGASGSIGLQLTIPFGDYTRPQAEIRAVTSVRTAEVQLADLEQQVKASVRDIVQSVELSWRQVEVARQARALAARSLEIAREKLQAGRTSNFEVLSFEAQLRSADTQALTAGINYVNALTSLDQQLGTTLETWRITLRD